MKNLIVIMSTLLVMFGCNTSNKLSTTNLAEVMKNKESISAFYEQALTVNGTTRPTAVLSPLVAEGYMSSSSVDSKNAEQLMGQLEFFWQLIPDLNWEPQEIVNEGDTYIVRSIATGTPKGDFMGLPTDGIRSFRIMSIDVHKMKDGKFMSTHHVEDWATAMRQLKPNEKDPAGTTMEVALAFMDAMGKGDMETMTGLMHDDMVWHNEGDSALPWIGPWSGKKVILEDFMPSFGANFQTIKWEPNDALSSGD